MYRICLQVDQLILVAGILLHGKAPDAQAASGLHLLAQVAEAFTDVPGAALGAARAGPSAGQQQQQAADPAPAPSSSATISVDAGTTTGNQGQEEVQQARRPPPATVGAKEVVPTDTKHGTAQVDPQRTLQAKVVPQVLDMQRGVVVLPMGSATSSGIMQGGVPLHSQYTILSSTGAPMQVLGPAGGGQPVTIVHPGFGAAAMPELRQVVQGMDAVLQGQQAANIGLVLDAGQGGGLPIQWVSSANVSGQGVSNDEDAGRV